jgi:hypothetical protein
VESLHPVTAVVLGSEKWDQTTLFCRVLGRNSIEYTVCHDQFSALAVILAAETAVLVIGPIYFWQSNHGFLNGLLAIGKDIRQICLTTDAKAVFGASLHKTPQVSMIHSVDELSDILQNFKPISATATSAKSNFFEKRMASLADKFFLTKAEQDALLED